MKKIAIIGSGMASAVLAHALHDFAEITVFEKARGIGGRLSTRYKDEYEFDLGAAFFSITHPSFQTIIYSLIQKGIVSQWSYRELSKDNQIELKNAFVGISRMNDLPKFLLKETQVCLEHKVTHLEKNNDSWILAFENQAPQVYDWVISTAPPLQSHALFPKHFEFIDLLSEIQLEPSFVLLLGLSSPLSIDWDYYPINSDNLLRCIVNSNKPDRKNKQSLVIETTVAFADKHLQDDEANIISLLIPEVRQLLSLNQNQIQYQALHKWRYATPIFKNAANLVCFDRGLGLGVCGDWLEGGGVEGAYLSGVRMAHLLRQIILGTKE